MQHVIAQVLDHLEVGDSSAVRNLVFFPLFPGPDLSRPAFLSMRAALERHRLRVSEVHESGQVSRLMAENTGDTPILLVDGEEVKGAKQNRIINTSILLEPHSKVVIPVSCTEQHRWSYSSPTFAESDSMMAYSLRSKKNLRMKAALKAHREYEAGQGEVWQEIRTLHSKLDAPSATGAMRDAYTSRRDELAEAMAQVPLQAGQMGLLAFWDGDFIALEYLARPDAYADMHEKLVKSFLIEFMADRKEQTEPVSRERAAELLLRLNDLEEDLRQPGLGGGEDLRWTGSGLEAAGLYYQGEVLHYHAFSSKGLDDEQERPEPGREPFYLYWLRRYAQMRQARREAAGRQPVEKTKV
jgi:hypothetical protein